MPLTSVRVTAKIQFAMKKIMLFVLLLTSLNGFAQPVNPFAEGNAWWNVADTYPHGSPLNPGFTETTSRAFSFAGDSVIGADTWNIMVSNSAPDTGAAPQFEGLVQQIGDVVLLHVDGDTPFELYDFSLGIGDSALFHISDFDDWLHVSGIDSVLVGSTYSKRIQFQEYLGNLPLQLHEQWIDGVGSIHGPLFPAQARSFSLEVPGDSLMLTCYGNGDDLLWSNPAYPDCEVNIVLGVPEVEPAPILSLYPQPTIDRVTITSAHGPIVRFALFDAFGRLVLESTPGAVMVELDLSGLASGAYVYRAECGGRSLRGTLVKIK